MKEFIYNKVELILLYLLNDHDLIDCIIDDDLEIMNDIDPKNMKLLRKIIEILREDPNITTGGLLCKLFNENKKDLITITRLSIEPLKKSKDRCFAYEFYKILNDERKKEKNKKIEILLNKLNNSCLTQEGKEELQKLILDVKKMQ